jgi:hypothetical protein
MGLARQMGGIYPQFEMPRPRIKSVLRVFGMEGTFFHL